MSIRILSPEVVALVHHVELNKSGWWKKAMGQVIKGTLWIRNAPVSAWDIQKLLGDELGVSLSEGAISAQLTTLISQGAVSKLPSGAYKLTESTRQDLSSAHDRAEAEREDCYRHFLESCQRHCSAVDCEKMWLDFASTLRHAIQVTGANLFHLLADGKLERETDWLNSFLRKVSAESREGMKAVLIDFFDSKNRACRNQVLRMMSAHFFAEASQLRPETIAAIDSGKGVKTIKVVLDTNFIFSILQLHDNPGDDSALSLVDLVANSGSALEIKLYVLPGTLEEAKRVLVNQMHSVERIRISSSMARVALTQSLSSIAKKFFSAAAKSPGLSADDFFRPYIDDLRLILDSKGIKVLDANPSVYNIRQDVIDDVLGMQEREAADAPERRKGYDALVHDAVLWHAVADRRRAGETSPFEVKYWAVSIDWRLIAFDRSKRAIGATQLPVILHPSNLVQLLQFWLPRSEQLEESLVDSLRLPLFFQSFDQEDEQATLKVLNALSRFENVDDIPEPTLKLVLANQALRDRIRGQDATNDAVFDLVRDELVSEHSQVVGELAAERTSSARAMEQIELLSAEAAATRKREAAAVAAVEEERLKREGVERERDASESRLSTLEMRERRSRERSRFASVYIVIPAILGLVLSAVTLVIWRMSWIPSLSTQQQAVITAIVGFVFPFVCGSATAAKYVSTRDELKKWRVSRFVAWIGSKAAFITIFAIGAVFQGWIWDELKSLLGLKY